MPMINIKSRIRNYTVTFGDIEEYFLEIEKKYSNRCYIIDANVWKIYKAGPLDKLKNQEVFILPVDEERKCLSSVIRIWDFFLKCSAKRNLTAISIGGGITQDITGFAASTIYRGINWVFVPTTLLAQADSCIGSKTSLNYKGFKNLIGTFYPPSEVFIDTKFLSTQKDIDFYSGLGEIVKLHILGGEASVKKIIESLPKILSKEKDALLAGIHDSLLIKQGYIEEDEFDLGRRNLLNYGHCFGHALETASGFRIPHGQAVVIGMMLSNFVSRNRGLLSSELEEKLFNKLLQPVLFINPRSHLLKKDRIITSMKKDKKRTGEGLPLVILKNGLNVSKVSDLEEEEIRLALSKLIALNQINYERTIH